MKIKKKSNTTPDIDSDLITVNNFFALLVKEISITKYGSDKELIQTSTLYDIYQNSDSMLKYLLKDAFKKLKKQCSRAKKLFVIITQPLVKEFTKGRV